MMIKSLTIYCSSSNHLDLEFYKMAEKIGEFLAKKTIKIIYGGGKVGIMGKISKSAYNQNGNVIGIIPKFLSNVEIKNEKTTQTIIVKDMTERKKKLYELGDAFLIMPGGSGTIEEASEIISWKFLGLHKKKIIIFNHNGYWDSFLKMYENAKDKKFANKNLQSICHHVRTLEEFKNLFP